jgi:hypothetical protein
MATTGDITGLDVLVYGGKNIVPQVAQGGYSRQRQSGVVGSEISGGATRQRKKYYGGTHIAEAAFYLETAQQQDYFELFVLRNEGKKFICHLAADRPIVEPYVVQFVGDVQFTEVNAKDSIASVTLEIFMARDPVLDSFLYELYPVWGDDMLYVLRSLREIVEAIALDD